jgi:heme/copper-type cytochrome/quinol oxidase subunit 3
MMKPTQTVAHASEPPAVDTRKLGMWIFLVSEVMFFSGLISAALNMKMRSPADANHVLNIPVTAVNTFVLICSSTAVVLALSALQDGRRKTAIRWMILTAVMGFIFVGVQANEYRLLLEEGFTPSSSLFAGGFYAVTSAHGMHVFLGVLVLLWLIARTARGSVSATHYMPFETWGLYWHFVDIVWIFLFTVLYLL